MKFLNNIEVGSSPNFTLPLTDGSSGQVLQTDGSGNVTWATVSAGGTDTNDYVTAAAFNTSTGVVTLTVQNQTAVTVNLDGRYLTSETHSSQGYLTDTGSASAGQIATYDSADTIGYASEVGGGITMYSFATGAEFAISPESNASNLSNGGSHFWMVNPADGTSRSAIMASDEVVSLKTSVDADTHVAFRNASGTGRDMNLVLRSEKDTALIMYSGGSGSGVSKTAEIQSVETGDRLDITNYDIGQMRFANAHGDPFMFYHGDGNGSTISSWTNKHSTLIARLDEDAIAIDGTNNPSRPNFRFLDDGDTGMYLKSTGVTAFASGGSQVFSIPSTAGTSGYILEADGSGGCSWVAAPSGGSTYTAGDGLDLTGTVFSLESDLRGDVQYVGNSANDYIEFDAASGTRIDFYVNGAIAGAFRNDGAPELHCDGDIIAYSTTISDARLKEDVETIENASEKVSQLRGVEYTWKKGSRKGQREIGLIAQEVEEVVPSIVREKELVLVSGLDDSSASYKTVDYEKLIALLIESNKEQQDIIAQLEERVIDLENRL
jgi:hypothetical protein